MAATARRFSLVNRASAQSSGGWCARRTTISPKSARGSRPAPAAEETAKELREELALWEGAATGDYLTGDLSAVDLTVYPLMALFLRIAGRRADFVKKRFHRPQSFGLDGSHARAPDRPAHLAAALERGCFGLTAGGPRP